MQREFDAVDYEVWADGTLKLTCLTNFFTVIFKTSLILVAAKGLTLLNLSTFTVNYNANPRAVLFLSVPFARPNILIHIGTDHYIRVHCLACFVQSCPSTCRKKVDTVALTFKVLTFLFQILLPDAGGRRPRSRG